MQLALRDINDRYDAGMEQVNSGVDPQDILGLAQSVATVGKNASDWGDDVADVADLPAPGPRTAADLTKSDRGILMTKARRRPGAY